MNKTKRTAAKQQELLCYLREHYEYEPEKGMLRNKKQGTVQKVQPWGKGKTPYQRIMLRWKGSMLSISIHHAVWAVCHGCWPTMPLDHIDGDIYNNHIENLRECTQSENNLNTLHPWKPNARTGVPGTWVENTLFITRVRGKRMLFSTPYQAFFIATICGKRYRSN